MDEVTAFPRLQPRRHERDQVYVTLAEERQAERRALRTVLIVLILQLLSLTLRFKSCFI